MGRPDGPPSLSRFPSPGRPGPSPRRGLAGALGGAGRLAGRRVQAPSARPVDRLEAGAAVPAAGPDGEQHAVPGARGPRGPAGPRVVLPDGDDTPVGRRLAGCPRPPRAPGGDASRDPKRFSGAMYRGAAGLELGRTKGTPAATGATRTPTASRSPYSCGRCGATPGGRSPGRRTRRRRPCRLRTPTPPAATRGRCARRTRNWPPSRTSGAPRAGSTRWPAPSPRTSWPRPRT